MGNRLLTIELSNLSFHAKHGVYAEEKLAGGQYNVNLFVSFTPAAEIVGQLEETVNYVSLYEIVKEHMEQATPLLETVAMLIADKIHEQYAQVKKIQVQVTKLEPPITQFVGHTGVNYTVEFD